MQALIQNPCNPPAGIIRRVGVPNADMTEKGVNCGSTMEGAKMKKLVLIVTVMTVALSFFAWTAEGKGPGKKDCTRIKDGTLVDSIDDPLVLGFDGWGYNYQAHLFNGYYCDAYRDAAWCQAYADIRLVMKWNDAWLSNKDCDGDGALDRHAGFDSYIGSSAWLTNHESGEYLDNEGNLCRWNYFVKIVAVPNDAYEVNGVWYTAEGEEIGHVIWGQFATIQEVSNDPCAGEHGVQYVSPAGPGFGTY